VGPNLRRKELNVKRKSIQESEWKNNKKIKLDTFQLFFIILRNSKGIYFEE